MTIEGVIRFVHRWMLENFAYRNAVFGPDSSEPELSAEAIKTKLLANFIALQCFLLFFQSAWFSQMLPTFKKNFYWMETVNDFPSLEQIFRTEVTNFLINNTPVLDFETLRGNLPNNVHYFGGLTLPKSLQDPVGIYLYTQIFILHELADKL